jgi:AraC-like DNA-binding protein
MILFDEERPSDSPFVERVWRSHSEGTDPFLSIAISHCELVVSRLAGKVTMTVRGPETKATPVGDSPRDGEWFGILLKLGTHLAHLPTTALADASVTLPTASSKTFWLANSSWQFPDYENAETFIDRLVLSGLLLRDPIVEAASQGQLKELGQRSIQYRFLQATGITQSTARQIERARSATLLLRQGVSIPDTILQAGYYDQPHLTRSLRRFIGQTPAQLLHHNRPEQLSFLYKTTLFSQGILPLSNEQQRR